MEIDKIYQPQTKEKKWYKYWMDHGMFTPRIDPDKKPYTILIPPPNVTGILHMGHVLNNTYQDVMVRYQRMTGRPTLWLPGVDHAGIATQNVVEKELAKEGKTRFDVGREKLVERIWEWKEQKGGRIIEQLKQLGASCDWSRERYTMDDVLSKAVRKVFVHLYEKDLIYKGNYIINWCPRCNTALSNDEVEHEDETGKLWHLCYPFSDGSDFVTVATTRPETMLGDVAVAVNPNDERYKDKIGQTVILPFIGREIPIIADEYVDMTFGTGCVKITPAHDPNDFLMGQRHGLEPILVMDDHGIMNENAGPVFVGKDRFECRRMIVEQLQQQRLLAKIEDHQHAVGHCYRCNTVIEPYLSDQWFVRMQPLAEPAIDVVNKGEVRFIPERWTKVYLHWMENIRDWCISRQIWWGHRIPAWYCECGEMIVSEEDPTTCPKCGSDKLRQDEDVLDTWFSSWLWPFSTMGWPEKTEDLEYFLPTNLLVTAPGIIYLWVARMIMSTLEFTGKIPFDTVFLHGMVLDEQGRKMSKSLGNSPDPIDLIAEYGADALRFSMIFNTPRGQDSYFSEGVLENGRNFANKIWNAYRFIMMGVEKIDGMPNKDELELELADRWILSRLSEVTRLAREHFEAVRFNDAAQLIQEFIWKEFCSWYLELSKDRIYSDDNPKAQRTAKYILLHVLEQSMRLLHPLMPFITEEIWQSLKSMLPLEEEALIIAKYPEVDEKRIDHLSDAEMQLVQDCISCIRNLRKQMGISPGKMVDVSMKVTRHDQTVIVEDNLAYFTKLAKVENLTIGTDVERPKPSLADVVTDIEIYLPLTGLVDIEGEIARLEKQEQKLAQDLKRIEGKLNNEKFTSRAPKEVVDKEREKYDEVKVTLDKTRMLLDDLR